MNASARSTSLAFLSARMTLGELAWLRVVVSSKVLIPLQLGYEPCSCFSRRCGRDCDRSQESQVGRNALGESSLLSRPATSRPCDANKTFYAGDVDLDQRGGTAWTTSRSGVADPSPFADDRAAEASSQCVRGAWAHEGAV